MTQHFVPERDERPVFVIGDVHGHLDRLEALFKKAGIVDHNPDDVVVVQLGDLITCVKDTRTEDETILAAARDLIDIQLWGNHDIACIDGMPEFNGYWPPTDSAYELVLTQGYKYAHAAHGWLITHAGLAPEWTPQRPIRGIPYDAYELADWLNGELTGPARPRHAEATYTIGRARGGVANSGGILWRDVREHLEVIPQIFGHSHVQEVEAEGESSWCIDVGGIRNGRLAGIWLPSQEVVEVKLEA